MSVAPPLARPTQGGRHRSSDGATGSFAALTAELAELGDLTASAERPAGSRHAAPTASFSRAARTAGLSLAALGALAGAGGVATQGLGDDPAPQTGDLASPSLAAADLAVAPAPAASPAAVSAPAVLPAAAPAAAPAASPSVTATPVADTASTSKAKSSDSDDADSDDSDDSSSGTGSSVATKAIAAAKSKLGDPYKWGSTGPNSFDCSGLMVYSFKQAGKSLPRTSRAQSQVGTKVSMDDLQPGDLIFLYSPVSHVVMYIGDGKIIEAPTSGKNVRIKPLSSVESRAVSARRVA